MHSVLVIIIQADMLVWQRRLSRSISNLGNVAKPQPDMQIVCEFPYICPLTKRFHQYSLGSSRSGRLGVARVSETIR